jgi:hypothetical protein
MERRLRDLRSLVAGFEQELNRAVRELVFVRASYEGGAPSPPVPGPPESPGGTESPSGREPPKGGSMAPPPGSIAFAPPPPPGRFGRFTLPRYNRAVEEVEKRQGFLSVLTVALSATIGAAIVTVTLVYATSDPPLWMALLPAIWLVPVPFFVLTFRGTRRVLTRNHLALGGDL